MSADPLYAPPHGFAALEPARSGLETSRFIVLPVPYEQTTTFGSGTKSGPDAILRASREMELWDDELQTEVADLGIHTCRSLEPCASGPGEMVERIREAISALLAPGRIPVILGGEHTVSVGAVRAMVEARPGLTALILDAHADLRDRYQGSPLSHACAARRISEHCPVVQAGVRSLSKEEADFARDRDWAMIPAREARSGGNWFAKVVEEIKGKPVYLSIDLDVFDPAIMPSVGTPEPGGLGWDEVLTLTSKVARHSEIVAFDVVELMPIPGLTAPDFLAAKLIYKIMGYVA